MIKVEYQMQLQKLRDFQKRNILIENEHKNTIKCTIKGIEMRLQILQHKTGNNKNLVYFII